MHPVRDATRAARHFSAGDEYAIPAPVPEGQLTLIQSSLWGSISFFPHNPGTEVPRYFPGVPTGRPMKPKHQGISDALHRVSLSMVCSVKDIRFMQLPDTVHTIAILNAQGFRIDYTGAGSDLYSARIRFSERRFNSC
jgi:hypothetical protein